MHMDEYTETEHVTREGSSSRKRPAPRGTASYPRKRAVTACQTCRARRTKCDNLKPKCSFCQKSGAACVQTPTDLSSFDPASLHIIDRIDQLQAELRSAISTTSIAKAPLQSRIGDAGSSIDGTSLDLPTCQSAICGIPLLPPGPEKLLEYPHGQETNRSMISILRTPLPPAELSNCIPPEVVELNMNETRSLLESFLDSVHIKNPILQELPTRKMVTQVAMRGLDWSPNSCLTLLICALGSIATPFGRRPSVRLNTAPYIASQAFFTAAQKRIGVCLIGGKLVDAQCLFLAGVYQMCVFKPLDAWRLFSQSLACCQDFVFSASGITPAVSSPTTQHIDEQIAEQAIYWSAWKSERELRHGLDLRDFPIFPTSPGSLYPSFFPTPPTPTSAVSHCLNDPKWDRERIAWYFYLTEISLRRVRQRIVGDMLEFRPRAGQTLLSGLAQLLPDWELEVVEWVDALPSDMDLSSDPAEDDICKFILRGHLHDLYESMYWPFLSGYLFHCKKNHTGCLTRSVSDIPHDLQIAKLATKSVSLHVERIMINKPGFNHRHHGTWGLIWSCSRSAAILLELALLNKKGPEQLLIPEGWEEAVQDVIELNKYWQQEAPDTCYRLPMLEHALKQVRSDESQ